MVSWFGLKNKKKKNIDLHIMGTHLPIWPYSCKLTVRWWVIGILYQLRRSQSSLHIAQRCLPDVHTYISIDHEHQNGIINSFLVGVIIGDWKYYNHQGLCFNSKHSIRVGWNNHLRDPIIWYHPEDSNPALYSNLYHPNRHGLKNKKNKNISDSMILIIYYWYLYYIFILIIKNGVLNIDILII